MVNVTPNNLRNVMLTLLLCLLSLQICNALPVEAMTQHFDLKQANKTFDQINLKLSVENLNQEDLLRAVETLTALNQGAERCVNNVQKKLANLNDYLTQDLSTKTDNQGVDLVFLNTQKKELSNQQAECHLFTIRSKEAIDAYQTTLATLAKKAAMTREKPLWKNVKHLIHQANHAPLMAWAASLKTSLPSLWVIIMFFWGSLLIASVGLFKFQKSRYSRIFLQFQRIPPIYIVLLTTILFAAGLILYPLFSNEENEWSDLSVLASLILFYALTVLCVSFVFKLRRIRSYFISHLLNYDFFRRLLITISDFLILWLIGETLVQRVSIDNATWQLMQSLYLYALLAGSFYYIRLFCIKHQHFYFIKHHPRFIRGFTLSWIILCILLDIEGYHRLAFHLNNFILLTIAIVSITTLLILSIQKTYYSLYVKPRLQQGLSRYLGYRHDQTYVEFYILKIIAQGLILFASIYLIGCSIDVVSYYVDNVYADILDGVHFASLIIYPIRIISGAVIFCVLFLISRVISTTIIRQHQFAGEEETQVAIASLLTYLGFSIALIIGLVTAGFNFTGLAIVAGALSVGIGLGLQSIVNNFVSGLILLIEKPIRPGDRINVDGAEGFVKKIRIRSTQILTPAREDIIIPNSDLITRRVTNYMYSDKNCQIHCRVNVAFGTDTILVRDILLDVANQHEDVVKTGRSKPVVLFKAITEKNLMFELGCLIKDVNKKNIVQSELNFAINEQFRVHHIVIA